MNALKPNRFVAQAAGSSWRYGHRGYAFSQAFAQLQQHRLASLGTLVVLGIALALPILLLFVSTSLHSLASRSLNGESLTLYLDASLADAQGAALSAELGRRTDVRDTQFISSADALSTFVQESGLDDVIESLTVNPLPSAIIVYPEFGLDGANAAMALTMDRLADEFSTLPTVTLVQTDLRWVRRLQAVVELIRVVATLLGLFLLLTALLVLVNTIRLELLRRQREREVATLLGASQLFLNRPMVYTGAIYGFLGGVIGSLLALSALIAIRVPAADLAGLYDSAFLLPIPDLRMLAAVLLVTTLLGLFSAIIALHRPSRHLFPG